MKPDQYQLPQVCPYGCGGTHFQRHGQQGYQKALRDFRYSSVTVQRYQCVNCRRSFRVYPEGVLKGAQQSARLKGRTVLLYVLGLSYGAIEDITHSLGDGIGKTTAYNNAQAAGVEARAQQLQRRRSGGQRRVVGVDATYIKVKGENVGLVEVVVDDHTSELLGLEIVTSENSAEILGVIEAVMAEVQGEVLVSDDHGAYVEVVEALGVEHQLCRSHVQRNVEEWGDSLTRQLQCHEPPPQDSDLSPAQLLEDLEQVQRLVRERPADGEQYLEHLYDRYKEVPVPAATTKHSVWYRMRMLVTRLWNRWRNLTLDLRRNDLDGTNNSCERLIGWWIKERYRTMRGYKRQESVRNIVALTTLMGAHESYFDMTPLVA